MSTETQTWAAPPVGTPCWVEIPAIDVQASKKFYTTLFPDWEFKPATEKYPDEKIAMFSYGGTMGLTGGIVQIPPSCKPTSQAPGAGVTIYHFVESIEETHKRIEELGGKSLGEKEPEGENGFFMYVSDVAGNRFGIYEVKKKSA